MKLLIPILVLNILGLMAISGCTPRVKEPRVCDENELKVKYMTKHLYRECIE